MPLISSAVCTDLSQIPSSEVRIASRSSLSPPTRVRKLAIRLELLVVAVGHVVEHVVEVVDQVADHLVAVGQGLGDRGGVPEQALQRAAFALEHLDDLVGELVDVVRRQRLEQRLEAVEQHRQIQRRRRCSTGIVSPSSIAAASPTSWVSVM